MLSAVLFMCCLAHRPLDFVHAYIMAEPDISDVQIRTRMSLEWESAKAVDYQWRIDSEALNILLPCPVELHWTVQLFYNYKRSKQHSSISMHKDHLSWFITTCFGHHYTAASDVPVISHAPKGYVCTCIGQTGRALSTDSMSIGYWHRSMSY